MLGCCCIVFKVVRRRKAPDPIFIFYVLGMWVEGSMRFPKFSLTTHIELQKYELTVSPSFLITFLHRTTKAKPMTKALGQLRRRRLLER
jgi:hypothetical protein